VELRAVAGLGAETRGAQQRRVCGVQLCSKNGSASQSGALDCLVQLTSASELDLAADRAHTGGASRGRAGAVTRPGADAGVGTSIAMQPKAPQSSW
jgi:hypothetical protein